jgi:hypothetical protein
MEEAPKDKMPSVEDYVVMKEFEDVFKEISGLPPKEVIKRGLCTMYKKIQ